MDPFTQYVVAAVLFVLGLAAIGGATFGRKRTQRLILAIVGVVLWAVCLVLYSQAASQPIVAAPDAGQTPPPAAPAPPAPTVGPQIPGRIVFHSRRTGDTEIWVMNADGSQQQRLTDSPDRDIEPTWSPDGQTIAFSSARDDAYNIQVYLTNADGSDQRPLMDFVAADYWGSRWSPDGEWILFYTNVDGPLEIYKVRKDGSDLTNLSNHPSNDLMADWSPDGSRVVFVSERDLNREIYVMDADGGNQQRLTDKVADDLRPRWSPDGATILFESDREGLSSLYLMDAPAAGAVQMEQNVRLLTFPRFNDVAPAWALDGAKIIFGSDRNSDGAANWDVYIMNTDGSDVVRLTDHGDLDRFPDWTP